METRGRSLVKAVLWNGIGLISMTLVGFFATGSVAAGGSIAAINTGLGLVSYLIYERAWARVKWGRIAGGPHA